ncbi:acyltransferase [Lacticigenium naphthae]|uniref:acyltransferase n=1 Tax=Lacticigenium naphthae TaxID=515351 RepID=UPI0012EB7E85|nr:acyltransferase family protein [Lacticigenium naphthae]
MELKRERLWYADILRLLAILMVLTIHITSKDFHRVDITSVHWQLMNVLNSLSRISVPLLFMVSGIFFLDPDKEVSLHTLLTKNISRLIRAFIFWSAIYVLFNRIIDIETLFADRSVAQALPETVTPEAVEENLFEFIQGYFHLWFLFQMAQVYLFVPLLRPIAKGRSLHLYAIGLAIVVGILTPTLRQFPVLSNVTLVEKGIQLEITFGYLAYFLTGSAIARYDLSKTIRHILYTGGILASLITILGTAFYSIQQGSHYTLFYEYLTPNVFVMTLAAFAFIQSKGKDFKPSPQIKRLLVTSTNYSFGVYLVHVLIRDFIWLAGWNTTLFTPWLSIPVSMILVPLGSIPIIWLMKRIPFLRETIQ